MKLPNGEQAIVDIAKLRDYCLSKTHPVGKNKARVFEAVLGFTADDAEELQETLLQAAEMLDVVPGEQDAYGQRYTLDLLVIGPDGQGTVRSGWIVRIDEDYPRLTTCYVL